MRLDGSGSTQWDRPQVTGSGIVAIAEKSGGYPHGDFSAIITATGTGTATLNSLTDADCLHAKRRCELPQAQFTITIVIPKH